jgi:hypothetical protein
METHPYMARDCVHTAAPAIHEVHDAKAAAATDTSSTTAI